VSGQKTDGVGKRLWRERIDNEHGEMVACARSVAGRENLLGLHAMDLQGR
jgi:hypothetical protein